MLQPEPYVNRENPRLRFRRKAVREATSDQLLLMLYDGAVKFVNLARVCMEAREPEAADAFIQRARDIVREFIDTLNMDYEIAKNLYRIYDFLDWRLLQASQQKDHRLLDVVLEILLDLRATWAEAAYLVKRESAL